MIRSLEALGVWVVDGKSILEHARAIESAGEIRAFRASLATREQSVRALSHAAIPSRETVCAHKCSKARAGALAGANAVTGIRRGPIRSTCVA